MIKKAMTSEGADLMKISGSGEVFLADMAQEIQLLRLEDDRITANGANVLAFEAGIDWDIKRVEGAARGAEFSGGRPLQHWSCGGNRVGLADWFSDGPPVSDRGSTASRRSPTRRLRSPGRAGFDLDQDRREPEDLHRTRLRRDHLQSCRSPAPAWLMRSSPLPIGDGRRLPSLRRRRGGTGQACSAARRKEKWTLPAPTRDDAGGSRRWRPRFCSPPRAPRRRRRSAACPDGQRRFARLPAGARPNPYRGDGMWIWYVSQSSGGDLARIARKAHRRGIETVYIKSSDGSSSWSQFTRGLVSYLHSRNLRVCGWQFVYGIHPGAEARRGAEAVRKGADCLVIDAESTYEGRYARGRRLRGQAAPQDRRPLPHRADQLSVRRLPPRAPVLGLPRAGRSALQPAPALLAHDRGHGRRGLRAHLPLQPRLPAGDPSARADLRQSAHPPAPAVPADGDLV